MIPYSRQDVRTADVAAVAAALRDPLLTQGPKVKAFEAKLAEITGAHYAVAFSSGTAALHGAYAAVGVRSGRGVITSPITFAATANAALHLQGPVRFVDVDPDHIMLDPDRVAELRVDDVAVLAPVHFAGHVAPMERIAAIARERGWRVVEDAAHALGARYRSADGQDHTVGACAHSDLCCFSFHPVKQITTGEGGAVTTNDPGLARKLIRFRSHGITRDPTELTGSDGPWYYEQLDLGLNYRITDFQCALGLAQLDRLTEYVERRRSCAAQYDVHFSASQRVRALLSPPNSRGSYHLYVIRVPATERRRVYEGLLAAGIGANVHYIPVYRHPYYRAHGFGDIRLPNAESYYAEAITIPLFPALTDEQVSTIAAEVRRLTAA